MISFLITIPWFNESIAASLLPHIKWGAGRKKNKVWVSGPARFHPRRNIPLLSPPFPLFLSPGPLAGRIARSLCDKYATYYNFFLFFPRRS